MKRKAEFLGIEEKEVHGQKVMVKRFASVTEPTIDYDKTVSDLMAKTGTELEHVKKKISRYVDCKGLYDGIELEDDIYDFIDCAPTFESREKEKQSLRTEDIHQDREYLQGDGTPMAVDKFFRSLK